MCHWFGEQIKILFLVKPQGRLLPINKTKCFILYREEENYFLLHDKPKTSI
jgi:hypothetical protein